MSLLFDYYGGTLTEKQADVYESYHTADLSLSEIAENNGITRQGVHDLLSRAEQSLLDLESKLGFVSRFKDQSIRVNIITAALDEIEQLNNRIFNSPPMEINIKKIRDAMKNLVGNDGI